MTACRDPSPKVSVSLRHDPGREIEPDEGDAGLVERVAEAGKARVQVRCGSRPVVGAWSAPSSVIVNWSVRVNRCPLARSSPPV